MSATKTQQIEQRKITLKDLITWTISLAIIGGSAWGGMKVNEAILNTRFNSFKAETETNMQYIHRRMDRQDEKLDEIIEGIHKLELQLKDKKDR